MASDINERLARLQARRKGSGGVALEALAKAGSVQASQFAEDSLEVEDWEKRGTSNQRWTRYAIGVMQPVGAKYTQVSEQTGEKVANQLRDRLAKAGINAEFELQGSVPLNVHIKRVSDVDVLAITTSFKTYHPQGARALQGEYRNPSSRTAEGVLSELRLQVETDLVAAFPAATVDKSGAKAVKVSGGSLPRSVDVHIDRVATRCDTTHGGLRKSIRLCKSVKADSDRDIQLSSFDIAAIMYHADMSALRVGQFADLAVLAETQRHLDALWQDPLRAGQLRVPDGSRLIFDDPKKRDWLLQLSIEMDDLLQSVYDENAPTLLTFDRSLSVKRDLVKALTV
jgi:hypothetical protein